MLADHSNHRAMMALKEIQRVVDEQSNMEGLWERVAVQLVDRELRRLHDVIERFTISIFENRLTIEEKRAWET